MLLSYNQVTRCHVPKVNDIRSRLHENLKIYTGYSRFRFAALCLFFAALCLFFEYKDNTTFKKELLSCFRAHSSLSLSLNRSQA